MSKVGICTVQSYRNSEAHEIIGISKEVLKKCFQRHKSSLGGLSFAQIAAETLERHKIAYLEDNVELDEDAILPNPGEFHYRSYVEPHVKPEAHVDTPASIIHLQKASKSRNEKDYAKFTEEHNKNISIRIAHPPIS